MATLHYKIVTPERLVLEGEAESITTMTQDGEITILPHHEALVTLLKAGEMQVKQASEVESLAVSTGMITVDQNGVTILADTAERSDELELAQIEEAKKRAEENLINTRNRDDVGFADAAAHLERELARYRVALKKTRRGSAGPSPSNLK